MSKGKKKNIVILFFTKFIRLDDVIKWSAISFIGFILGIQTSSIQDYIVPFIVFILSTFCLMSFTFLVNNYCDADSDRGNPRRMHSNAIASGEISKTVGILSNIVFIVVSLLVSLLFKPEVFFFCVLLVLWMGIYSVPPLRLKGRPGIDVIWHFFAFMLLILWGSLVAGSIQVITWFVAVSIGVFSCIGQVMNHVVDYTYDKESGTITFAVKVGPGTAKKTVELLLGIHVALLFPLLGLYSLRYVVTLLSIVVGLFLGFLLLQPKKDGFPTKQSYEYYVATVVGGSVYVSCLIYHILSVFGIPTLSLLYTIGIL